MKKKLPLAIGLCLGLFVTAATAALPETGPLPKRHGKEPVQRLEKGRTITAPELKPAGGTRLRSEAGAPLRTRTNAQMQHPVIYGGVIMTDDPDWADWGIYEIPTSDDGEFTRVARGDEGANRGGGVGTNDTYYSVRYFAFYGMEYIQAKFYDLNTWQLEDNLKVLDRELMAYDLSYDPVSGNIYGCFYSNDSDTECFFGTADYRTGTRNTIAQVDKWNAFAIDKEGNAFAIDMKGDLLGVDKQTGAATLIGSTGIVPRYPTSGTIDPRSGRLYWVVCPEDGHSYLYTVDLSTAEATFVTQFAHDEQVTGLYIPMPEAEETAPAAVTGLTLDFPRGSLSGTVSFTAPTTLFNGESASGELTYNIVGTGIEPMTGGTQFGATCSVPVTVAEAGEYEFIVTVKNETGLSPRVRKSTYIGMGTPTTTKATVSYADGMATITWDAVTEAADGGYIDPEAVTYRIIRYPDETTVAEAATGTHFETPLPEPAQLTTYYYSVTPCHEGIEGGTAFTNRLVLGTIMPPYTETFDTQDALSAFTIIDANRDEKTWSFSENGSLRLYYNSTEQGDDWLITPPVQLEAGNSYRVTFDARNSYGEGYEERIEVFAGEQNNIDAMTIRLLEPTLITEEEWRTKEMTLIPEHSGRYFIGFHGISDPDKFWLGLDNISIGAGVSTKSPAEVTDLKATADFNGLNKVEVSFTTPTKAIDGSEITALTKVEIYRDDAQAPFHTFDAPATQTGLSCTDTDVPTGNHTYSVVAYNSYGEGAKATATTFVGINVPDKVSNVSIVESEPLGTATLTWQAPATDRDGNPINPAVIRYDLCNIDGDIVESGITETTHTARFATADTQEFAIAGVIAVTDAGNADPVYSPMIPVGKPYDTPYRDSFNSDFGGIMGTTRLSGSPQWTITVDEALEGVRSQDHDDALVVMKGAQLGDAGAVYTGKISLVGTENPSLSIYAYKFLGDNDANDDTNTLAIQIRPADGVSEYTTLTTITNTELAFGGWNRVLVPLTPYKGSVVQFRFVVTINSYSAYALDNLTIGDLPAQNLMLNAVSAPTRVKPDTEFTVTATVGNTGTEDASSFIVELLRNGDKIDSKTIDGLASGAVTNVDFTVQVPVVGNRSDVYAAQVVYAPDEQADDNYAETKPVVLELPDYPTADGLTGSREANGVRLTWDAIDLSKFASMPVTDSFEEYAAFSTAPCGDWKFVDGDKGSTFVPEDITGDGVTYGTPLSYFIMDATHPNLNSTFAANTGDKYLGAFYNTDTSANDDWAIAPRLSGHAQTIRFYAKSYHTAYGIEEFEVRYSTTGNEVEDFTEIVLNKKLETNDWTEITAEIPEGAHYVAIHYTSDYQYMFFIDDFTYTPAPWSERVTLLGYNLYRDGNRLNTTTIGTNEFTDPDADGNTHKYQVTAVYDQGESAPSEAFILNSSGIDLTETESIGISGGHGHILITGANGLHVEIYRTDGVTMYASTANADSLRIPAATGIYLVKAGGKTVKVVVR